MLQNQFQPTLSGVQTPAENQETGVKCRRVVPGSGSSRCQGGAVGIQGMQQLASSGHSQLGSGRGSSCYLGNWALVGVGFLLAVDARGDSVQLFSITHSVVWVVGKLKMLSLRKGAVARGNHLGMFHQGSEVPKTQATCESISRRSHYI